MICAHIEISVEQSLSLNRGCKSNYLILYDFIIINDIEHGNILQTEKTKKKLISHCIRIVTSVMVNLEKSS